MKSKGDQVLVSTDSLVNLLEPIEKENPSGRWVRYENKYLAILAEKNEDDPNFDGDGKDLEAN